MTTLRSPDVVMWERFCSDTHRAAGLSKTGVPVVRSLPRRNKFDTILDSLFNINTKSINII